MSPRLEKSFFLIVAALCLLSFATARVSVFAQKPSPSPTKVASPTPSPSTQPSAPAPPPSASGERTVSTGNALALLAFQLIKPNLPPATKLSSGFRTAQNQVEIIRQFANHEGIPVPPGLRADDPSTWQSALNRLRAEGYIIAAPGQSPHSNPDLIVLDLSRAGLTEILNGCREADRRGVIQLSKTIKEHKNGAVHVEMQLTQKGLESFGIESELARNREDDRAFEQRAVGQLREKSRQEVDPEKRIALLQALQKEVGLSDPAYQLLEGDITKSQQEVTQLEERQREREALKAVSDAREQGDWELAAQRAQAFYDAFPNASEAKNIVQKIEAQRLYQQAVEIIFPNDEPAWQCDKCHEALPLIEDAIRALESATPKLSATVEAKLRERLSARISRCRSQFILKVVLWVVASLCLLVGLFVAFRPGKPALYCADGDQYGESFPLDQPEIIIGSLGEPDGEAQIVINDRKRKISRSHCVIKQSGRRFYLKDLASANGTSVNGRRLEADEYHELKKGDEISLAGTVTLIVRR